MKVKDINEALKDADPEAEVVILGHNGEVTPFVLEEAVSMNPTGEIIKFTGDPKGGVTDQNPKRNFVGITRLV